MLIKMAKFVRWLHVHTTWLPFVLTSEHPSPDHLPLFLKGIVTHVKFIMIMKIRKSSCCGDAHAFNNEILPFSIVLSTEIIVCLIKKFRERDECNFVRHRKNEVKRRGHLLSSNMGFILGVEANKASVTGKYSVTSTWQILHESRYRISWNIKLSCNCSGYI